MEQVGLVKQRLALRHQCMRLLLGNWLAPKLGLLQQAVHLHRQRVALGVERGELVLEGRVTTVI